MSNATLGLGLMVLVAAGTFSPALAGETGIAVMHAWQRTGSKTCIRSHWHYGTASGQKTRKVAEAKAISNWEGMTGFEYGSDWMRFTLSESKNIKCDQQADKTWNCLVEGRACKFSNTRAGVSAK